MIIRARAFVCFYHFCFICVETSGTYASIFFIISRGALKQERAYVCAWWGLHRGVDFVESRFKYTFWDKFKCIKDASMGKFLYISLIISSVSDGRMQFFKKDTPSYLGLKISALLWKMIARRLWGIICKRKFFFTFASNYSRTVSRTRSYFTMDSVRTWVAFFIQFLYLLSKELRKKLSCLLIFYNS